MRLTPLLLAILLLPACAAIPQQQAPPPPERPPEQTRVPPSRPQPAPASASFRPPQIMEAPGLAGIIRAAEPTIVARLGPPRLDVVEGDMKKLQFASEACVLDVFLYPLAPGGEPVATWIEARRASDGAAVDRVACIQALSAR